MITIRPERSDDHAAIHAVQRASFPSADEALLVERLRDAGRLSVSLVAEDQDPVVGHVAVSPVTLADCAGVADAAVGSARPAFARGAGLAPVAVLETHRRQGIAARLVRASIDACRADGFGWIVVLGEPHYYARFGFRRACEFGLSDEYSGGDAFQALALSPGALPIGAGLVRYAPEFAALVTADH